MTTLSSRLRRPVGALSAITLLGAAGLTGLVASPAAAAPPGCYSDFNPNTHYACPDTAQVFNNSSVLIDVLANDSNATLVLVNQASSGTAVLENGQVRYTPAPGFVGTASFTYYAHVGMPMFNMIPVTVTVLASDAAPTAFSEHRLDILTVGQPAGGQVTADGSPAPTYAVVEGALPAGLSLDPTSGTITGVPTVQGPYSFVVRASNASGSITHPFAGDVWRVPGQYTDAELAVPVVGVAYSDQIAADGYPAPTYELGEGSLPPGLSLDPQTGEISGTPTAAGYYAVDIAAVNDAGYTSQIFYLTVEASPTGFSQAELSGLVVGQGAGGQVTADGLPHPTYAVTAGALPAGLTLDPQTGGITGTPTTAGAYSFTVTASNGQGSASTTLSGVVTPAPSAPTLFTDPLIAGLHVGVAVTDAVAADGYPAPTYEVTAGTFPPGLTLDPQTGAITGTPTFDGNYVFTITATNASGSLPVPFAATVTSTPTAFGGTELEDLVVGQPADGWVKANGFPLPVYTVTAGALPAGLTLDPQTGDITGVPTTAGAYSATITATNAHGSVSTVLTGVVTPAPAAPTSFTDAEIGGLWVSVPVVDGIAADGYPAPTYAVTQGALPTGLTLDAQTGAITGTPTAEGSFTFTVTATNSLGSFSRSFTTTVGPAPVTPGTFATTSLGTLVAGTAVKVALGADGSPAPTYAVTAGALPPGLTLDAATGTLAGTPVTPGTYAFTVTASNPGGSASQAFSGQVTLPASVTSLPASNGTLSVSDTSVAPGGTTELVATGYAPGSTVTFVIYSEPIVLGTAVAGADGVARLSVVLPAGLAAGTHTVVSLGVDAQGAPRVLTQSVTITAVTDAETLAVTGSTTTSLLLTVGILLTVGATLVVIRARRAQLV